MSGAPSQLDMWDYKPKMVDWYDKDLPDSIRNGQRITTMTSGQARFPIAPSIFNFKQHDHGAWVSELLPHTAGMVDDLAVIKTVNTEAINHDPAITYIQTGSQLPGRPSTGLGSTPWAVESQPSNVCGLSTVNGGFGGQAYTQDFGVRVSYPHDIRGLAFDRMVISALPLESSGVSGELRRKMLDQLAEFNRDRYDTVGDRDSITDCTI